MSVHDSLVSFLDQNPEISQQVRGLPAYQALYSLLASISQNYTDTIPLPEFARTHYALLRLVWLRPLINRSISLSIPWSGVLQLEWCSGPDHTELVGSVGAIISPTSREFIERWLWFNS